MEEKIRHHVENLFKEAPPTKRAYDLKEELIFNLQEKYRDLRKEGKPETEAFEQVISGIGEVDELIQAIDTTNPMNHAMAEASRKKTAFIVSLCVGLYILDLIAIIIIDELGLPDFITAPIFFLIAGISTCILIYHFMSRPKYIKQDDTIVEEFKEWKSEKEDSKAIRATVHSSFWTLIVALYFIISFAFGAWAYSWILFLIAAALSNIIDLCFQLKK